jgi:hypothetical protein
MSHRKSNAVFAGVVAALVSGVVAAPVGNHGSAQRSQLTTGGGSANFGSFDITGGFMPDPQTRQVTSGGNIDASTLGVAGNCRGYVTAQPDVIVRYNNPRSFLRFFVRGQGDTTLVINDGAGHWWCDDDSGGGTNPMVDINNPPSGQYDVWIGSYRSGENIRGTLGVTEMSSNRP